MPSGMEKGDKVPCRATEAEKEHQIFTLNVVVGCACVCVCMWNLTCNP